MTGGAAGRSVGRDGNEDDRGLACRDSHGNSDEDWRTSAGRYDDPDRRQPAYT